MSQFSCDDEYVAAQVGCFQYFTGLTGTLQSYNYAGLAQIKGMNYKNCIRAEEGYCCIQVRYLFGSIKRSGNLCPSAESLKTTPCFTIVLTV